LQPTPTADDPIVDIRVDREIASEGFTYTLASRRQGTVHVEQVLEYNKDPGVLRDRVLYSLTVEAQKRLEKSSSIGQMLALLQALDCDVRLTVRARSA
jgi:hypothetical protein